MKRLVCILTFFVGNVFAITDHPMIPKDPKRRPGSYPYLCGDTFRGFCDHIVDETAIPFDPKSVKSGETIFVNRDMLDGFFQNLHSKIEVQYILVTHNSHISAPGKHANYLEDPKLFMWFCQNTDRRHPKLITIPVGLANPHWPHGKAELFDNLIPTLKAFDQRNNQKLMYMNFTIGTNKEARTKAWSALKENSLCDIAARKPTEVFLREMSNYRFVISPLGNGLDCHRTWEALYAGCIPIVESSTIDQVYEGLPIIVIKDWNCLTREFLEAQYARLRDGSTEKIWGEYWLNLIKEKQALCRSGYRARSCVGAVTYELGYGRFGDQLLSYLHAKWLSFKHNLPISYAPFKYSHQLELSKIEGLLGGYAKRKMLSSKDSSIDPGEKVLYVVPFFGDFLVDRMRKPGQFYFDIDWEDPAFHKEVCKAVAPIDKSVGNWKLPEDMITLAIHIRTGGEFDSQAALTGFPLKFPSIVFYVDQIKLVSEFVKHQKIYAYIFTDDKAPNQLVEMLRAALPEYKNIFFDCRQESNCHDANVLEDFFAMTHFDCMIRPASHYSYIAARIGRPKIEVSPYGYKRVSGKPVITQVEIRKRLGQNDWTVEILS